jgi:hypothetical protein
LRFPHLELFLVRVFIPLAPEVGVLSFFSWSSSSFPQREVYWKYNPLQSFCCDADYLFSPLSEGAGVPSLCRGSPAVTVGSAGSVGGKLGFQLLDSRDGLFCRELQCEVLGSCAPWGSGPSGASCTVAGYSFPSLSGESVVPAL